MRETKYDSSMEKVASIIEQFCSFPVLEQLKLFRMTLFSFLIGNEDMHLKKFSLIRRADKVELTPAYDLVNSTTLLQSKEELALTLMGKKRKFKREHLVDYYGHERLKLNWNVIEQELEHFQKAIPHWNDFISISFLSSDMKQAYHELLEARAKRLELI